MRRGPTEGAALHERALELNPNLAPAWALSAITQIILGNSREAERRFQRYKALSPLDPYSFMFDGVFGFVHLLKHDYQTRDGFAGVRPPELNPLYASGYLPYLVALGYPRARTGGRGYSAASSGGRARCHDRAVP